MKDVADFFTSSFSAIRDPKVLGLAFHRAWIATFFFSANVFVSNTSPNAHAPIVYPLSLLALIAVLISGVLAPQRVQQFMRLRATRILSPILMAAGSLLLAALEFSGTPAIPVLCGLLTGFGSGLLLFYWAEQYGRIEPAAAQLQSALAFMVAIVIYAIFLFFSSNLFYVMGGVAMALLSGVALRQAHRSPAQPAPKTHLIPKGELGALRIGAAALVISFVNSATMGLRQEFLQVTSLTSASSSTMGASGLAAVAPLAANHPATLEFTFAMTQLGSTFILLVLIAATIFIFKRSDLGFIYRFVLVFLIASVLFIVWPIGFAGDAASIMINVGYSCFELIFWIALSNISYRYHTPSLRVFGLGRTGWVVGVFLGGLYPPFPFMESVGEGPASPFLTLSLLIILLVVTYTFILPERSIVDITTGFGRRMGSLHSRCEKLAKELALTQRETEVLMHLVKGRDTSHIQQALNISAGTVSTHRQRIYQKAGVHSRQEILDLLEQTNSDKPWAWENKDRETDSPG
ncbi:MAG: helix-turn-helix transcriptional regulator [Coriobacteriaceae bacterium]|jgi:DNA-binding CsgD family transcriptional regulator|nr:helix-turn-helix transcriptional regulator [Coriobacteriaceae bacterium]